MNLKRTASPSLVLLLLAIGSLKLATSAHAETPPVREMRETNRQIVSDAFNRWQLGTGNFFDEVLAQDVVWTIKGSGPNAGVYQGQGALMEQAVVPFTQRLNAPVKPVSKRVWADGDHVIVNWEGETTARDGLPYRNSYAWIMRMEDGKAIEVTAFLDLVPYDDIFRRIPLSR